MKKKEKNGKQTELWKRKKKTKIVHTAYVNYAYELIMAIA